MTSGDEAGALTKPEGREDSGTDAHDNPAPADADSGDTGSDGTGAKGSGSGGTGSDGTGSDGPATAGAWAVTVTVLSLLLIAGLVTTGVFWNRTNGTGSTSNGQQAAEATARTAVTDLFTTDYTDPGAFAARLKPLAAGQFLSVVTNASTGFAKILAAGKVQTTGKVQQIAVQQYGGDTAKVAVLAYETVKNTQTPQGSERAFRMSLTMVKSGSNWLVSNLEFIQ